MWVNDWLAELDRRYVRRSAERAERLTRNAEWLTIANLIVAAVAAVAAVLALMD